jgi:hypothetical protein
MSKYCHDAVTAVSPSALRLSGVTPFERRYATMRRSFCIAHATRPASLGSRRNRFIVSTLRNACSVAVFSAAGTRARTRSRKGAISTWPAGRTGTRSRIISGMVGVAVRDTGDSAHQAIHSPINSLPSRRSSGATACMKGQTVPTSTRVFGFTARMRAIIAGPAST